MRGFLLGEGAVGKAEVYLAGPVTAQLATEAAPDGEVCVWVDVDACGNVTRTTLASDDVTGRLNSPLLAVVHAHGRIVGDKKAKTQRHDAVSLWILLGRWLLAGWFALFGTPAGTMWVQEGVMAIDADPVERSDQRILDIAFFVRDGIGVATPKPDCTF